MYSTSQIAALFGLHPNTIRLYEDLKFISAPERKQNGYRVFTDEHAKQIEIVRIALRAEVLQNELRKQAIKIIQSVAERDIEKALRYVDEYIDNIEREIQFSSEAVRVVKAILSDIPLESKKVLLTRKQTADHLHITIDTLRNWELNGLIEIKRKENGYPRIRRNRLIHSNRYSGTPHGKLFTICDFKNVKRITTQSKYRRGKSIEHA